MKNSIVVGLGFGDEGKGLVTSALASHYDSTLVVRYGGGHQCGHTVQLWNIAHKFSNFGSGSLTNATTYWSKYCTLDPIGIRREYEVLEKKGIQPKLIIDPKAMVVTPFDILANRQKEREDNHGSCGVGFGQTIQRNEDGYRLYAQDLLFTSVLDAKLEEIRKYYKDTHEGEVRDWFQQWCNAVAWMSQKEDAVVIGSFDFRQYDHIVYEGHQGVLLDQEYGFYPHVTRSYTTPRNALEMIDPRDDTTVFYVTRAYQTRHGNGPMTGEVFTLNLRNKETETNKTHEWQGEFRISPIDFDLLRYSLRCSRSHYKGRVKEKIVVTCTDQLPDTWPYISCSRYETSELVKEVFAEQLRMSESDIIISMSPSTQDLDIWKQES